MRPFRLFYQFVYIPWASLTSKKRWCIVSTDSLTSASVIDSQASKTAAFSSLDLLWTSGWSLPKISFILSQRASIGFKSGENGQRKIGTTPPSAIYANVYAALCPAPPSYWKASPGCNSIYLGKYARNMTLLWLSSMPSPKIHLLPCRTSLT